MGAAEERDVSEAEQHGGLIVGTVHETALKGPRDKDRCCDAGLLTCAWLFAVFLGLRQSTGFDAWNLRSRGRWTWMSYELLRLQQTRGVVLTEY